MIKLILFDLDGVIADTKEIHYKSLNDALSKVDEKYKISEIEHLSRYDGLKTLTKLKILTKEKGLPLNTHELIYETKQNITLEIFTKIKIDERMCGIFKSLKNNGYLLGCCTNCIKKTALVALAKTGVIEYLDVIVTNNDVKNPKPHPEIYWKAMSMMGLLPHETLIIEDSYQGLVSAYKSNANVLKVENSLDVNLEKIMNKTKIKTFIKNKWEDDKLNVVIPMAGAGSRFEKAGFELPKPLIDVNGQPMIKLVIEAMNISANYIYIVQKSHREKYNLDVILNMITPNCKIVEVDGLTEGAACTVLTAKNLIDNENPLMIMNSDQYIEWDSFDFMFKMNKNKYDGCIMCFEASDSKWSFAKTDENNFITEVAEKKPISNQATAGIYYWKNGSDFVKYTEQMIEKNIRVNNEFYVCPVYNELIQDGKIIYNYNIPSENMWGLGTPEDLNYYLKNKI